MFGGLGDGLDLAARCHVVGLDQSSEDHGAGSTYGVIRGVSTETSTADVLILLLVKGNE